MENNDYEEQYLLLEEENKKQQRRKNLIIGILSIIIIVLSLGGFTYSFFRFRPNEPIKKVNNCKLNCDMNGDKKCDLNCDTDNDGKPNLNIDRDNDGKADVNITKNGKPYINIDFAKDGYAHFNIDTNGDNLPDFNLMNQDKNKDGICDLNCDTNNDGWPDINIDFDGDGVADANIYEDGKCTKNCDEKTEPSKDTDGKDKTIPSKETEETPTSKTSSDAVLDVSTQSQTVVYMGSLKNVEANNITPGWSDTVEFKITNAGNYNVYYKLDWVNIINELTEENNVEYTLIKDGVVIKDSVKFPYSDTNILDKVLITPNTTYYYTVKLEFKETGIDQTVDTHKTFSGSIKASLAE